MKNKLKTFLFLAGTSLAIAYICNKVIFHLGKQKGPLNAFDGYTYDSSLGSLFYTKRGTGPALLLIHNISPTSSSFELNQLANMLADRYCVYTIDLPACGRSENILPILSSFQYSYVIQEFIEDIIKEEVILVGDQYSASSLLLASQHSLVHQLYLLNPPSLKTFAYIPSLKEKFKKYVLRLPIIGTTYYNILFSRYSLKNYFINKVLKNPFKLSSLILNGIYQNAHYGSEKGKFLYASLLSGYFNINIHQLEKNSIPPIHIIYSSSFTEKESAAYGYADYFNSVQLHPIFQSGLSIPIESFQEASLLI